MVLEPIEVMDDMDEFKKLPKSYFHYMAMQLIQGFELMASQLRGKLEAEGSRSFHHGEAHNTIPFYYFYYFLNGYRHNNSSVNSLRNYQQSTSLDEHEMIKNQPTCEKSLDTPLKEGIGNHEVENKLTQGD